MNDNLILVSEDDEDIRGMLAATLEQAGFSTVQAKDGNTAARIVTVARPVAVVTDVRMPALTGLELCRLIRRSPELSNTAVLMTSAHTSPADIEAGLRAGADDYLPKPLSPKQLVRKVQDLIDQRRTT